MTDKFFKTVALGRAPDGTVSSIQLGSLLTSGYRRAYMRKTINGSRVTVPGRVTTRHGYASRTLDFKPLVSSPNAKFFITDEEYVA